MKWNLINNAVMALTVTAIVACGQNVEPVDYVDPFIGTAFHGHTYPGATTPFGAVQLSPDNYRNDWDACSGYHYDQNEIIGFSHTHLSGTGCADLADILFHPTSKDVDLSREGDIFDYLPYSHSDETATPGYYAVQFKQDGIKAEMSATRHTGWHRYTWKKGNPQNLIIDMHHGISDETIHEVELFQTAPNEIRGMRRTTSWSPDQYIYFVAQFSRDIESIRYIDGHKEVGSAEECSTMDRQVVLSFGIDGSPVVAKVGVSIVDYKGAASNLDAEGAEYQYDFDGIRQKARDEWNSLLSKVKVEGGTKAQKRVFYTSLYHTAIVPNITSDNDKQYRRQNDQIAKVNFGQNFYSTLSLWDVFRAWLPLSSMIYPEQLHDIVCSCLDMYDATGELPIWPLSSGETDCMIGYHSIPFIVDAYFKGILPDVDSEFALKAMVESSNNNDNGSSYYTTLGFIPANRRAESVSTLLEYCYDDWCIAKFAEALGKQEIAQEYYNRAKNYVKVFDGSTGFFRGKNQNGTFVEPFNIFEPAREYTEATAWQYRYFIPHDFYGFAQLLGGVQNLAQAVDDCFSAKTELEGDRADITGLIGQYAHGNEPSHHMAFIYNYVGQPWKTQEWTRRICEEMYTDKPDGLCGNEDCGQMSAWYVMVAMGLYEVCPGSGQFALTTPVFDKITLTLMNDKELVITANNPARNPYIQKVTLDGKDLDRSYVIWEELMTAQELHFELGTKPADGLWTSESAAPYSLTESQLVSKPWYKADDLTNMFTDSITIELGSMTEGAQVHYTIDGSQPCADSPVYSQPLVLTETTTLRAVAYKDGYEDSEEMSVEFGKAVYEPADHRAHTQNGVNYSFYHGVFSCAADVDTKGEFVSSGTLSYPSFSPADQPDFYGFVYTGWIYIPETRIWQFSLYCDDGGVLYIGNRLVVDNDGTHAPSLVNGRAPLEEGYYPFTLRYLEYNEGQELELGWWPAGAEKSEAIPQEYLFVK